MAIELFSSYTPLPWQIKAHAGDWTHGCFVGGKGGGKTRFVIEELIQNALDFPGSLYLIGRKTLPALRDSTMREFMNVMPDALIKDYNKSQRNVEIVNGSCFIFRPLDDPKKFESIQLSGFMFDEADEVEKHVYDTAKSRVRQMLGGKVPRYRTALVLNPVDEDHWIPRLFLHDPPPGHKLFYCSTMDNMENLPPTYVDELKRIYTEDMQQRMIHGLFGKVHRGRPVYPQFARGEFIHAIEHDPKSVIWRSWDFGYNHPACIFFQFLNGRMVVLGEKMGDKIYLDDFVRDEVLPYQMTHFSAKCQFRDICDPRGSDESDKGKTSIEILNDFGIFPLYKRTKIPEGIKAIKSLLETKGSDGLPNFVIHPRCRITIEALRGGYHREEGEEDPRKDGYYEHLADALRYGAIMMYRRHRANALQALMESSDHVFIHPVTGRRIEL